MKLAISLVLTASFSCVLGMDVWNMGSFQGTRINVPTSKDRCVRLDENIGSIRAETCDVECYGYKDVWCEEPWNRIDCQGYAYVGVNQLKSVMCK
jgi:hypothetical protein